MQSKAAVSRPDNDCMPPNIMSLILSRSPSLSGSPGSWGLWDKNPARPQGIEFIREFQLKAIVPLRKKRSFSSLNVLVVDQIVKFLCLDLNSTAPSLNVDWLVLTCLF